MPAEPHRLSRPRLPYALLGAASLLLGLLAAAPGARAQSSGAPLLELNAGIHLIHAEFADDDATRMRGLMFRRELAPNHGMLFRFDAADRHCMWMRNTVIPLAVAFLDEDGTVVNIEEMQAQTDTSHCAKHPVRYALEMDAGWFAKHGVAPGFRLQGIGGKPKR